jgi:SAM-dependent methyltransferase
MAKDRTAEVFPERRAGGFTRFDGTVQLYLRAQALCDELPTPITVVDFGAGRGSSTESKTPLHRRLTDLRAPGRTVIGLDVDEAVLTNPHLDEAHVIEPSGRLPLADASVDLLLSDWTFEHLDDPAFACGELARIVKPGGWLCARTPNKWGLIGMGARTVPNAFHVRALRRLQPERRDIDVFPTVYRLNTRAAFEKHLPRTSWDHLLYGWDGQMAYGGNLPGVQRLTRAISRITPESMRAVWLVFMQRR